MLQSTAYAFFGTPDGVGRATLLTYPLTSDADQSKVEGGEKTADLPSGYSRGEGQKPVSKAYKDNWNAIYAKEKKKKR